MTCSHDEIRKRAVLAVCESLALNPEDIRDGSKLIDDLGMDSLDFLDIMFSLEKTFGMKIRDADFDRLMRPDRSDAAMKTEDLTEAEIAGLIPLMPALKHADGQIPRKDLFSFVTLETLTAMVERKLASTDK